MAENHDLRRKIARCKRSLLIIRDTVSVRRLEDMIEAAELRLAEIEADPKVAEVSSNP